MEDELIDILDSQGEKTGEVRPYSVVHKEGLFHRTVHVWVLTKERELLLQKRAQQKWAYPGYWEASVGGHLTAGEESVEGACNETFDELGLRILPEECELLFSVQHPKEDPTRANTGHICHEIHDVYLVRKDIEESSLVLPADEVEEVRFLTLDQFEQWVDGGGEPMVPHPEYYNRLLGILGVRS